MVTRRASVGNSTGARYRASEECSERASWLGDALCRFHSPLTASPPRRSPHGEAAGAIILRTLAGLGTDCEPRAHQGLSYIVSPRLVPQSVDLVV